jgi:hypothetical protein
VVSATLNRLFWKEQSERFRRKSPNLNWRSKSAGFTTLDCFGAVANASASEFGKCSRSIRRARPKYPNSCCGLNPQTASQPFAENSIPSSIGCTRRKRSTTSVYCVISSCLRAFEGRKPLTPCQTHLTGSSFLWTRS